MKAEELPLIKFLRGKQQFTIPIYQRPYSWTLKQCNKFWDDIEEVSRNDDIKHHFIGSIVRIEKDKGGEDVPEQMIIDGQQRITTIILLLSALINNIEKDYRVKELREEFLINTYQTSETKYRLLLTQQDKESLKNIIDNNFGAKPESERIKENYDFFKSKMEQEDPEKVYAGIRKLMMVDISLDPDHDDPQLIFESLNSTGLDLSQADLIRNYILMRQSLIEQEKLYTHHWREMEKDFGQTNYNTYFNKFMRDYLTAKRGNIPNINNVYNTFKEYVRELGGVGKVGDVLQDVHRYSTFYTKMVLGKEEKVRLKNEFDDILELKVDVAYPFLLEIYADYMKEIIDEDDFKEILSIIQSYIFRRSICGIATNTLNKTFAGLHKKIDKNEYMLSLKANFALMQGSLRFPKDSEFLDEIKQRNIYSMHNRTFLFKKYENFNRKEFVNVNEYTIEHIMPQNEVLRREWQIMLGENWKEVQEQYLHTLGNLTLTGYNSELSDKPFNEKKTIEGGFNDSPLKLNNTVRDVEEWNEDSIKRRADKLADEVLHIWKYVDISEDDKKKFADELDKKEAIYTRETHKHLSSDSPMSELFDILRGRVLKLDSNIREKYQKKYVAYKLERNFVDITAYNSKLVLHLNMEFADIHDPEEICRDVSEIGHYGNGDVEVSIQSLDELENAMFLIKQSYEYNL